ncbi:autotransporter-associated beta strand repeat-containing protein, partial [Xanthobacter sp. DSM 24535]|uniref:beta strand repeat-containing protein n=1 Tax=Roseixanthobacter psychrophilus TaxID=3119917 RepID=UPI003728481B
MSVSVAPDHRHRLRTQAWLGQTCLSSGLVRTLPALLLALGLGVAATPAGAANFDVANEAQLADAVAKAANGDTITFKADIELSAKGKAGAITTNITINGNGHKLLGKEGTNANGLYVQSGTVTIQNLDLSNLTTKGTSGGNGGGGGGGGAGTGAGLFVGAAANVTLSNVILKNNSAVGGNGGVGVIDGRDTTSQGGGGGGSGPNAGNGQASTGGSVGQGGPIGGGDGNGGNGQWGAGGGGSGSRAKGGNGGFGGGGGGSLDANIGTGGFLGGNGGAGRPPTSGYTWYNGGGGGGAGMGGAIFVQNGGTLSVTGTLTVSDNTVAGGTGGSSRAGAGGISGAAGGNGGAAGAGLFLAGNGTLNLSSAAGETQTISDAITDQTGLGGTGANAGSWGLVKAGAGTLTLTGANSYTGGTTVSGGVLRGNSTSLKGGIVNTASVVFDQTAAGTYAGIMSGNGALTVTGGKLSLTGANTYTGLTSVTGNGTLEVTAANTIAAASTVALDNGALLIGGGVALNNAISLTNRGSLGSSGGIATVSGVISGAGALDINTGTVALAANNTFTGGLNVTGGTALFTADANLGAAGGAVTLTSGGLVGAAANAAANFVTNRNLTVSGTGGITGAQHAVDWRGAIGGTGALIVSGANVVELSGTNTYSGGTLIQGGALKIDSDARLGDLGGTLDFSNNGRLLAAQSFTTGRAINVGTGGGGFELGAGTTLGLSGAITGGVVNQTGQGTLVVTGSNAHQGFANYGGTLQGDAATLGRAIRFDSDASNTNSRKVVFAQATDGTFTGNIGGTGTTPGLGNVVKTGAGKLTLMGESNFKSQVAGAAEFEVQAGTLQGNSKSLAGNIQNNAALIFDQYFDGTYASAITGAGSVTVSGTGKLALSATSTIAGATSVTGGGTLVVTTANNFGASSTLGLNGGTLMLGTGATAFNKAITVTGFGGIASTGGTTPNNSIATVSGVISGSGQLDINSNTVILAANNTFTGGLRVIGSNAQALFTTDANLGAAGQAITLQNGGIVGTTADAAPNLTMTRNLNIVGSGGLSAALHPLVYNGTISGNGTFIKSGGGIVNLTGTNTATGGTAVRAGTLQIASDDKLGAAGARLELSENGHLWVTQSMTTARAVTLGGVPGGGFQLDSGTTLTLTGAISGTMLSLLGTGTLVLNGTSTYAGITNSGGTILGNTDTLKGNIIFDYNANNTN